MPILKAGARHAVCLTLNGRPASGWAEPRLLLTDFLRQELGASGTHVGCEHGVCGACTVLIDGIATRACLMLAVQVEGRRVDTVEGLAHADGTLSDLQAAFRRHHALQCGFCTPGILMSVSHWLKSDPAADEKTVREMLTGHLCRCTGYDSIVKAVIEVVVNRREAKERSDV